MAECDEAGRLKSSIVWLRSSLSTGIDGDPMAGTKEGQGEPFLRDVEPKLLLKRPIRAKTIDNGWEIEMVAFEVIGMTMLALFFSALVDGNKRIAR